MKWKYLFYINLTLWLGTLVIACGSQRNSWPELVGAKEVRCNEFPTPFGQGKAKKQIRNYDDLLSNLKKSTRNIPIEYPMTDGISTKELMTELFDLRGYNIPISDLIQIQDRLKTSRDSVFIMFAINKEPSSILRRECLGSSVKYLDMYFVVQSENDSTEIIGNLSQANYRGTEYYDFPKPCPTSCPDDE